MPDRVARLLDVRTSRIADRIDAIDDFVEAGYEVHLNFSPVIVHDGRLENWAELLDQVEAGIGRQAKAQPACEVIMLTHNEALHEVDLAWHPNAEEVLWRPELQQAKWSQTAAGTCGTAPAPKAGTSPRSPTSSPSGCRPAGCGTRSEPAPRGPCSARRRPGRTCP